MRNYQIDKQKVLYADECFQINGVCFYVHNTLGRFAKEKQCADLFEQKAFELKIPCRREWVAGRTGNRFDFVLFDKILVEMKSKPFLTKEDFDQVLRYLDVIKLDSSYS